jgi:hypothetical protein
MVIVANADFLSQQNVACVCVISQPKTAAIQRPAVIIFTEDLRRRIIAHLNNPSNISALLHNSHFEQP